MLNRGHQNIKVHSGVMRGFDCLISHDFISKSAEELMEIQELAGKAYKSAKHVTMKK